MNAHQIGLSFPWKFQHQDSIDGDASTKGSLKRESDVAPVVASAFELADSNFFVVSRRFNQPTNIAGRLLLLTLPLGDCEPATIINDIQIDLFEFSAGAGDPLIDITEFIRPGNLISIYFELQEYRDKTADLTQLVTQVCSNSRLLIT